MEYSSFYGGRKGSSFVLKKEYPIIASTAQNDTTSMIADFKSTTCQVNFGEYVIINNPNRLHPDQGKVFKRDYDVNSNRTVIYHVQGNGGNWSEAEALAYGAQEVGTITGAPGAAPHLYVKNYEEVVPKLAGEPGKEIKSSEGVFSSTVDTEINVRTLTFRNNDADTTTYIAYIQEHYKVPTFITVGSSLVYLRDLVSDDSFDGIDLIPGKYVLKYRIGQGDQQQITVYNDDIQYISVSARSDTNDETDSYIGFKFPYHTFATTSTYVQPYHNGIYADTTKVENIDNPKHPLSSTLKFSIPKGIQGNTPENLKVITIYKNENNGDISFSINVEGTSQTIHLWKQDNNDEFEINTTSNLPSELNSVENPFDIYVYFVRTFEDKKAGELVTDSSQNIKYYYLGLVSLIKNISYNDENGQISVTKTDGTTAVINALTPIKYVKSVEFLQTPANPDSDDDYQYKIQFKDNAGDDVGNPIDLDTVEALSYNDLTGKITVTSKSGKEELINENTLIKYVKDVEFLQTPANPSSEDDYQYKIQFKANTGTEVQPDEGESYIEYNNIGQEIDLDTVDILSYDDSTGLVTATYKSRKQEPINTNTPIEYINEVSVSTPDDDLFQSITFTYNTNNESNPATVTFPLRQVIRTDNLKINEINNVSNFSSEDLGETLYQNMSGLIGVQMNLIKKTPVANLNTSIINQLRTLGNDYENNITKIRYLGLLLKSETQNPKSNYIRYSYQTSEGDQLNIYAEGTNEIARIVTDTQDANNPRVLILNSSLKIRFERILNGYYDTFDDDYGWVEAFKLTTFEKRNVDIKYDITEEFMAEVAAADSQSDYFYKAQTYQTEKVVKYLNQTYPFHKESNSQLSDIVTILIGYNQWRVATSEDVLDEVVTIADVNGDNVFIPTGDVINNSQQILSEPKTAFYAYNEAILERTGTLSSAQQETYNGYADKSSRDNLVALFDDPLLISAEINSSDYSYTYQAKGGWYALSNLFSTTLENSSGGDGASIVFSSNPNTSIANADVDTILVYYTEE